MKNNIFDIRQVKGILLLSLKCDIKSDEVSFVSPLLKLCTFSRVSKEKGIEDAVQVVNMANAVIGHTVFALDIYGKIDDDQSEWFKSIIKNFPSNIRYNGTVAFNESTNTIKNYFALLFPTYYDGEGFAGTLIDALAAGVPVVASDWRYNNELVSENVTGVLFRTHNLNAFAERLVWIYNNQEKWNGLKINCVRRARDFIPENALEVLLDKLIN